MGSEKEVGKVGVAQAQVKLMAGLNTGLRLPSQARPELFFIGLGPSCIPGTLFSLLRCFFLRIAG